MSRFVDCSVNMHVSVTAILHVCDPPLTTEVTTRMNTSAGACLVLADIRFYTFDASTGRWLPPSQNNCWFPGLVITTPVPEQTTTSFTVTITGNDLICSTSHFTVSVRRRKWSSSCDIVGEYTTCKWDGANMGEDGRMCIAKCSCDGDDCSHVTVHIPQAHEGWEICTIGVSD